MTASGLTGEIRRIAEAASQRLGFEEQLREPAFAEMFRAKPKDTFLGADGQDFGSGASVAAARGLALEDPFAFARGFSDLGSPGEPYLVIAGLAGQYRSGRRILGSCPTGTGNLGARIVRSHSAKRWSEAGATCIASTSVSRLKRLPARSAAGRCLFKWGAGASGRVCDSGSAASTFGRRFSPNPSTSTAGTRTIRTTPGLATTPSCPEATGPESAGSPGVSPLPKGAPLGLTASLSRSRGCYETADPPRVRIAHPDTALTGVCVRVDRALGGLRPSRRRGRWDRVEALGATWPYVRSTYGQT